MLQTVQIKEIEKNKLKALNLLLLMGLLFAYLGVCSFVCPCVNKIMFKYMIDNGGCCLLIWMYVCLYIRA